MQAGESTATWGPFRAARPIVHMGIGFEMQGIEHGSRALRISQIRVRPDPQGAADFCEVRVASSDVVLIGSCSEARCGNGSTTRPRQPAWAPSPCLWNRRIMGQGSGIETIP